MESDDGSPVLDTVEQSDDCDVIHFENAAPCAARVCVPPVAVAVALPPAVPVQADLGNASVSGSEPGDEVVDVPAPKVVERPSVERLKLIARSIEHQLTHWPYNSQCRFALCAKRGVDNIADEAHASNDTWTSWHTDTLIISLLDPT